MGFFNKPKSKEAMNLLGDKLIQIGYQFDGFNLDILDETDLSIDEEVAGVVKTIGGLYEDKNNLFNYILISEYKNGKRTITLSKFGTTERDIKNVVDFLFQAFGRDKVLRGQFDTNDLRDIREDNLELPLRFWEAEDYNINFYPLIKKEYMFFKISSENSIK